LVDLGELLRLGSRTVIGGLLHFLLSVLMRGPL
jgi:hypothetical protein